MKKVFLVALTALSALNIWAQNPYMPMWEYIPDGEPYVFEDPDRPGEYRVYVYGSHDNLLQYYCGRDQVVWSAPVNDLTNWRYDGIVFKSEYGNDGQLLNEDKQGDVLYAPDVAMKIGKDGKKEYYFYPNNQAWGREGMVAKSDRPDGPFKVCNWSSDPKKTDGVLRFDPGVFVDDDGRVYGYWGFGRSYAAEFDPETMATVKSGTEIIEDMVSGQDQEGIFHFFEASSMRKIQDKYVFVYSRMMPEGEFGLPRSNYNLAYAYSDSPLGPWTYGGTLIDGRARAIDENGKTICTANPYGNTHGSLCEINGKWWVFYHRQTGTDEYSRQAMVAPVTVKVEKGKGGRVIISEGEYNSEGFMTEGLNPLNKSAAGWACYLTNPDGITQDYPHFHFTGSYIKSTRRNEDSFEGPYNNKIPFCPVVNNTAGSVVGYKYFNFSQIAKASKLMLKAHFRPEGNKGCVKIWIDAPTSRQGGTCIGQLNIEGEASSELKEYTTAINGMKGVKGKHALFFVFDSTTKGKSIGEFFDFQFVKE